MKLLSYTIIIEPDENGSFHGYVPALKGCHTCGDSVAEVKELLKDAINLHVQDLKACGELIPQDVKTSNNFQTILLPMPS